MPLSPAVEVNGLVKRYGANVAVDGLDLVAAAGQVTAVLGPNGAGKTSTVEICEGLRHRDGGQVRVLGLDPVRDAAVLRPQVGVMLQDGGLPNTQRAADVLQHVSRMYADPADTAELSERLGLRSFARTTVRRLSGGERQRLALAVALVGRPRLVFLDEPSAGLDPQARRAVWDLVGELSQDGVSVVLTTHFMAEAEALADQVVIVDHGRAIASGTVAELVASGGTTTLRVEAAQPVDAAALAAALGGRFTVDPAGRTACTVSGPVDPQLVAVLTRWLADAGVQLIRLELGRRTLEDVFLDLTGRSLR
ncbi:MAG: spermidine/putrescine ABC transporter ATP-binding protein [Cellulomonas sp. 73-145]|uniref:ABC transporter ATP-binding protein n=1 Tax=Cellulomonas sp. 73-145 TaxID=1895739 RepID=UPI0009298C75|nr:ABC transporter ATP-binding protein [Cellulomonas sp. 73-145]MBN9327339.1 ABC transporter ATP-binding protein [Cellulomonas sp.]OJV57644.1 MAG: spermidine/putrescine ABC transporter ATP-binding protein [Cellulomonas sp. 73-145]